MVPSPAMPPMPPLQRRYSVTGQTPPDSHVAMQQHSPKLQALDTSVQSTSSCGLCDPAATKPRPALHHDDRPDPPADGHRGRKISSQLIGRISSKRSATQLPSPSTPTTHGLPPKIARLGLEPPDMDIDVDVDVDVDVGVGVGVGVDVDVDVDVDMDMDMDMGMDTGMDMDEGVFTDHFCETEKPQPLDHDTLMLASFSPCSPPSTPPSQVPFEPFELDSQYDSGVESLALTPTASHTTLTPSSIDVEIPTTLLTLPPELRHQIYLRLPDLVLSYPLIYCLSTFNDNMQHPLASVSRLIRSEALAIFYSYNTWIIKLEFKMMYEAFQDWIIRLGDGAGLLRLVTIAVRGKLFKPRTSHASASIMAGAAGNHANGQVALVPGMPAYALVVEQYSPPDGDASFSIDLSEKYEGGRVELVRNDGTKEAGEQAVEYLQKKVAVIWGKRQEGTLNGQDWVNFVDEFLQFARWC